jgi:hypothetical protein
MLAVAATNAVPSRVEQDRLLSEATLLVAQNKYAEAESRLQRLTELQPDNPYLRQTLADVKAKRAAEEKDSGRFLRKQLEQTRLPEVNCREANPQDVIAMMFQQAKNVNYVWMVPTDAKLSPVTLSMRDIPLADALRYVADLAGLRYRVDAKAVIIYRPESAPAKNAQP